jgi:hypothetical protein
LNRPLIARRLRASARLAAPACVAFALALAAPAPAVAQSAAEKATARALATEAADRFASADYAGALERFSKAYQIAHVPTVGIYVARS